MAEVRAEPTPQLRVQAALLAGLPTELHPYTGHRLGLAVAELRRRETAVGA